MKYVVSHNSQGVWWVVAPSSNHLPDELVQRLKATTEPEAIKEANVLGFNIIGI